jgi:hypothetical protein
MVIAAGEGRAWVCVCVSVFAFTETPALVYPRQGWWTDTCQSRQERLARSRAHAHTHTHTHTHTQIHTHSVFSQAIRPCDTLTGRNRGSSCGPVEVILMSWSFAHGSCLFD